MRKVTLPLPGMSDALKKHKGECHATSYMRFYLINILQTGALDSTTRQHIVSSKRSDAAQTLYEANSV